MLESLDGRIAVVTGGGSGIGAATVARLAAEGVTCHALARRGPVKVDVTDRAAVRQFFESVERVDILVCAAGDNVKGRHLEQIDGETWDRLIAVNLSGAFYCIEAALPKLRAARGDVILVGSVSGQWPDGSGPAYQAAKAGLSALARGAGYEEHVNGVRFSVINPGVVDTPILQKRPVPPPAHVAAAMLRPEDVAEAVCFMVSLPRRAHVPELTMLPTRLQALGKSSVPNPEPAPE